MKSLLGCALPALVFGLAFGAPEARAASGDTLREVKARGELVCGVTQGLDGFSLAGSDGSYAGLDVDYCRAVAAAVFGDAAKVRFRPLSSKERFEALKSGEVDVLARVTTWSMSRDTQLGVIFAATNYYDGQALLVPTSLGVSSAAELDGARLCTNTGTTTELNITDYFRRNGLGFELIAFEKSDEAASAYEAGRCDVYTSDASGLAAMRLRFANPAEHVLLPEIISKEPLAPAVRQGDEQWLNVARWTHFAQLNAEELGISSENVDQIREEQTALAARSQGNQEIQRLLGLGDDFGASLGLPKDWAYQIVRQVGNYGEIFDAPHGPGGALGLARGLNALWTEGGLQYGIPVR
ncbi:amino acid ABC transporter substrate-binding protein [Neomegalonema sp.]|uniref:amino acid ABC transporter substrate-binding protein n=1 Tax=Neomegalonema sp. TaxID=2039713 RepID=UPI00262874BD|nr:amino acid ABC transporter substrate-binding protein [Neomegalonema sp.]MDD2867925.1 amino acid ABC transporter substrate-binding protein [Neomegalonema sp.]